MNNFIKDLNILKNNYTFLSLTDRKLFFSFNILALPFYFDEATNFSNYYRFSAPLVNYTRIKNSPSFYLIFKLQSDKVLKVMAENFVELLYYSSSNIFKSKKYFGYLLENSFYFHNDYGFNFLKEDRGEYFTRKKYLSGTYNSLFSDSFIYFSLLYNKFHRKYQNTALDLDIFISNFYPQKNNYLSYNFWDYMGKFNIVDTKFNSRNFFVISHFTSVRKYFSYFFLRSLIKKIIIKVKISKLKNLFVINSSSNFFFFLFNSLLNKADNWFFLNFEKLNFLYFLINFFNFFSVLPVWISSWFYLSSIYMVKLWALIILYYILLKYSLLSSPFLFFFKYSFIILLILFFNYKKESIFNSFFFLKKSEILYKVDKASNKFFFFKLSNRIYSNRFLLKATFRKHAIRFYQYHYLNLRSQKVLQRRHFDSSNLVSRKLRKSLIFKKSKLFLSRFKDVFFYFFRKNIVFLNSFNNSLVNFRMFILYSFFKFGIRKFNSKFWWRYKFINRKYSSKLYYIYKKKFYLKKKIEKLAEKKGNSNFFSNFKYTSFSKKSSLINRKKNKLKFKKFFSLYYYLLFLLSFLKKRNVFIYKISSVYSKSLFVKNLKGQKIRFFSTSILLFYDEHKVLNTAIKLYMVRRKDVIFLQSYSLLKFTEIGENRGFDHCFSAYSYYFFSYLKNAAPAYIYLIKKIFFSVFSLPYRTTDIRVFYLMDLFNHFRLVQDWRINFFWKFKHRFIVKYDDFILRIDFFIFILLNYLIEYFRIFKYNEYIIAHEGVKPDLEHGKEILQPFPDFHLIKPYIKFKRYIFFHLYNIYKIYFALTEPNNSNRKKFSLAPMGFTYIIYSHVLIAFFKEKKICLIFLSKLKNFVDSSILYYLYATILKVPYFHPFQVFTGLEFSDLYDNVKFFYKVPQLSFKYTVFYFLGKLWSSIVAESHPYYNELFLLSLNIKHLHRSELNVVKEKFYYQLSVILLLDYIDERFFCDYFNLHTYEIFENMDVAMFWLRWGYLSFIQLPDFFNSRYNGVFSFFKLSLDFMLWQIYNFSMYEHISFIIFDLKLLFFRFHRDEINGFLKSYKKVPFRLSLSLCEPEDEYLFHKNNFFSAFFTFLLFFFWLRDMLFNIVFLNFNKICLVNSVFRFNFILYVYLLRFRVVSSILDRFSYLYIFSVL